MDQKKQLVNLIQSNQWPHAAIIEGENQEALTEISKELIRTLICPQRSFPQDKCLLCQRFSNNTLTNLINLKSGIQPLKKEDLLSAIQQFSLFSLEPQQPKILLIEGGENLSAATANSLLKFLEEPPHNTFIIILSQNYSQMMSTIRSRCQRFYLINNKETSQDSLLAKIITTTERKEFIELSYQWANWSKEKLIEDLTLAYRSLIISQYPQLATATLSLINDLKKWPLERLSIANYLIILESLVGKNYENL